MKVSELMDNDLFMYGGHLCKFVIRSMDAIVQRISDNSDYPPCAVSNAEPIQLSEEMLKANGWSKQHMEYEEYMWRCPEGCTYLTQYNTNGRIYLEETDIELNYVHELQHALRLCGLNEMADNLKVE